MQRPGWRESIEEGVVSNLRVLHPETAEQQAASL
jgi:hypothetical protein